MSGTLKSLNNIRSLRAQARECTLETLEEILEKLQAIVADRREYEASILAKQAERENKRLEIIELIAREGFDPSELIDAPELSKPQRKTSKRAPRPAKYKYQLPSGETETWTGQGRMPSPIKYAIENEGKTLKDFLI